MATSRSFSNTIRFEQPKIAARLHLREHTVHRHVANILTKLDLPSRAAAAAFAARRGLV
jgi:DNA-binding NarL/FixJ family response regulator